MALVWKWPPSRLTTTSMIGSSSITPAPSTTAAKATRAIDVQSRLPEKCAKLPIKAPAEDHSATIEDKRDVMFIAAPFPCPRAAVERVVDRSAIDGACAWA